VKIQLHSLQASPWLIPSPRKVKGQYKKLQLKPRVKGRQKQSMQEQSSNHLSTANIPERQSGAEFPKVHDGHQEQMQEVQRPLHVKVGKQTKTKF